jgi:TM2 domain-containing membrane protein YozV
MKSKTTAALLAFFLGGLGIHKFYLGQSGAGIIYLLFCWTFIPGIIAFFEFILLLVMSDHDFNVKYNHSQTRATGYMSETSKDKAGTLAELKNLFDSGVITAEEYEAKRRKMLDSI